MSLVLHVGTETAYAEAESIRTAVISRASTATFLTGLGFLNSRGGMCKMLKSLNSLQSRRALQPEL